MTDHHDPAALSDAELDDLLVAAHHDLLLHTRENTDFTTGLVAFMDGEVTPPQPEPTHHSRNLVVLELRNLTQRARKGLPEGVAELRHALLHAGLSHPNGEYLAFLMTLAQALITVSDIKHDLAHNRGLAHNGDRDLALALTRDLAHDLKLALARDRTRARDTGPAHARDLDRALDLALDIALDIDPQPRSGRRPRPGPRPRSPPGPRPRPRPQPRSRPCPRPRPRPRHRARRCGGPRGGVGACVPAGESVRGGRLAPEGHGSRSLAGAVWNRATIWPASLGELVERHSEEIGDGVFQVRRGTERDPHDSVLA